MRDIKALAFVCALFAACASTDGGGGGDDGQDPLPTGTPVCGDAVCAASEVGMCAQDCGTGMTEVCGNNKCEGNEPSTCAADCTTTGGGAVCGNGQCESSETNASCPSDCTGGGGTCTLDLNDPATVLGCFLCTTGQCIPPFTQTECSACLGI
jgi:hypothetical protein